MRIWFYFFFIVLIGALVAMGRQCVNMTFANTLAGNFL